MLIPYPEEFECWTVSIINRFNLAPKKLVMQNFLRKVKAPSGIYLIGNAAMKTTMWKIYAYPELERAICSRLVTIAIYLRENPGKPMHYLFRGGRQVMDEH